MKNRNDFIFSKNIKVFKLNCTRGVNTEDRVFKFLRYFFAQELFYCITYNILINVEIKSFFVMTIYTFSKYGGSGVRPT